MNFQKIKPFFTLFPLSVLAYLLHKLFFYFFKLHATEISFVQPLFHLYLFFTICSSTIIAILIFIKQKNIDNVGQAFILLTCIKMFFCYIMLHPIIEQNNKNSAFEKKDFFVIFAVFLTIETVITIRLLNNKQ